MRRRVTIVAAVAAIAAVAGVLVWWTTAGSARDCSKPIVSGTSIDYGAEAGYATPEEALAKWVSFDASADLLDGHHLQPSDFTIRLINDHRRDAVALRQKVGAVIEGHEGQWVVTGAGPCASA